MITEVYTISKVLKVALHLLRVYSWVTITDELPQNDQEDFLLDNLEHLTPTESLSNRRCDSQKTAREVNDSKSNHATESEAGMRNIIVQKSLHLFVKREFRFYSLIEFT